MSGLEARLSPMDLQECVRIATELALCRDTLYEASRQAEQEGSQAEALELYVGAWRVNDAGEHYAIAASHDIECSCVDAFLKNRQQHSN